METQSTPAPRLGEMLMQHGYVTEEQLCGALEIHRRTRQRLGDVLVRLGYVTPRLVLSALKAQTRQPAVNLLRFRPESTALRLIEPWIARRYCVLPLQLGVSDRSLLYVAQRPPVSAPLRHMLCNLTGKSVRPVVALEEQLLQGIERYYPRRDAQTRRRQAAAIEIDWEDDCAELEILDSGGYRRVNLHCDDGTES